MLLLVVPVLTLVAPALRVLLLALLLLVATGGSLGLLLALRSAYASILRLQLWLCGAPGRIFANRSYVLRTIGRFENPGGPIRGLSRSSGSVPDSFSYHPFSLSGSDTPSQLFPQLHQGDCVGRCGGRFARERSSRASSFGSWLLQSPLCHPQSHRGLEACDRPLTLRLVGSCLPVSHGDSCVDSPISSSGRLDGVPGSPRCLPLGSGAPVISALPEVLRGGLGPAVSCSLFRPVDCPAGVHAGHGPCVCHHAPVWFQDPTLPG